MTDEKNKKKHIDFKYNLKTYWNFLKEYKAIVFFILIAILVVESKHVLDKFLFKLIIDNGTEFANNSMTASAFINILIIIAVVFTIVSLISLIFNYFKHHTLNRLESGLIADLKRKYFNHLVILDHNFHVSHKTGSMISRLTRGAAAVERMTDVLVFNFITLIIQLIVIFFSLLYIDIISAIIILVTVMSFIFTSFLIQRTQEESNIIANKTEDIEKGNIADIFTNIDSIKYFGKEKKIKSKYKKLSEATKIAFIRNWDYFKWLSFYQRLILNIGTFLLFLIPLIKFINGTTTIGTIAFVYSLYLSLSGYMFGFVHGIRNFYRSMADFQELFEYGKIKKEIIDKSDAKDLVIKNGKIEFKDIEFKYGKRKIFSDFNLTIPAQKKVAFVGHSGCGKTTLIKLLYRLYDIISGEILIDGTNIIDVKQENLRESMAIVPQECVLFDDTIYNNIAFSNPTADRKTVLEAIKFAQLDKIINDFPNKEKTIVGERGVKLSGGEKQRVSIARAILADKKILVLDEATSSLDSETEYEIQKDLEKLMKGRTSIVIAHRLSTIMSADIIVVMKKGRIVQMGKHSELIEKTGEYKRLWNLQKGGYIK